MLEITKASREIPLLEGSHSEEDLPVNMHRNAGDGAEYEY